MAELIYPKDGYFHIADLRRWQEKDYLGFLETNPLLNLNGSANNGRINISELDLKGSIMLGPRNFEPETNKTLLIEGIINEAQYQGNLLHARYIWIPIKSMSLNEGFSTYYPTANFYMRNS